MHIDQSNREHHVHYDSLLANSFTCKHLQTFAASECAFFTLYIHRLDYLLPHRVQQCKTAMPNSTVSLNRRGYNAEYAWLCSRWYGFPSIIRMLQACRQKISVQAVTCSSFGFHLCWLKCFTLHLYTLRWPVNILHQLSLRGTFWNRLCSIPLCLRREILEGATKWVGFTNILRTVNKDVSVDL